MSALPQAASAAARLIITGRVQGVGFRPFIYRLAHAHDLTGWVLNAGGHVEVHIEGPAAQLKAFRDRLISQAPPLARPELAGCRDADAQGFCEFSIRKSQSAGQPEIHVPPDQFTCADCLAELTDPGERRHRYPFINCTQCGPRYTIIRALPYDRPNTTLAGFPLCPDCDTEYRNPLDRRFHAQPLACPACGPGLQFVAGPAGGNTADGSPAIAQHATGNEPALAACVQALAAGAVVAVRGIGGYHLVCDAGNAAAVARLRKRKLRPHKPLAVMAPMAGADNLQAARRLATLSPAQAELLAGPMRPIVLAPLKAAAGLAPGIVPGLDEVGLMLPYSPLHHLLMQACRRPLVATSGNLSGEPVLTDPAEAERRLGHVADAFLHHNRPIERPADDPVYRDIAGRMRPLRLGRGNAPLEIELPFTLERPVLAAGAFMKNTIALAWQRRIVISPHIGDLAGARSRKLFERLIGDLERLYGVRARAVACDAHPDFPNSRHARDCGLPLDTVFHHHAHAAALAGEFRQTEPLLVFTWDGAGFGPDGTLWGGEALLGRPGAWRRFASFRPFRLPGGDRAVQQPWRTALSLCWSANQPWPDAPRQPPLLRHAWETGLNSPWTSAAGRLFDAAAALAGAVTEASYDGQGPMQLEALCRGVPAGPASLPLTEDPRGVLRVDWQPLVPPLADTRIPAPERAALLHESLANTIVEQANAARRRHGIATIGLTGGVFQNRRLCERAAAGLAAAGFRVLIPERIPLNDAGISYGQVIEHAARAGTAMAA